MERPITRQRSRQVLRREREVTNSTEEQGAKRRRGLAPDLEEGFDRISSQAEEPASYFPIQPESSTQALDHFFSSFAQTPSEPDVEGREFSFRADTSPVSATLPKVTLNDIQLSYSHQLRLRQHHSMPARDFLLNQPDIDAATRAMLVNWLVRVTKELKADGSVLFLSVSILDRYLGLVTVRRDHLQLVGVTALLIAFLNVEEQKSPCVEHLLDVINADFTPDQVSHMKKSILDAMGCVKLSAPTIHSFLVRFHMFGNIDPEVVQLSTYLAELTLLDPNFARFQPSMIAAAAISLGLHSVDCVAWNRTLEEHTSCCLDDLSECMTLLFSAFSDAAAQLSPSHASREKYSNPNPHLCVALIPPPDCLPFVA